MYMLPSVFYKSQSFICYRGAGELTSKITLITENFNFNIFICAKYFKNLEGYTIFVKMQLTTNTAVISQ